jgi:hypothetical protein
MIELRQASKEEMQGDVQSANNPNMGSAIGKLHLELQNVRTNYPKMVTFIT